jgi:hypothetical protein
MTTTQGIADYVAIEQVSGSLSGKNSSFVLQLIHSAILIYIWDRDLDFRRQTLFYWIIVWVMFPAFGVIELFYCLTRLLAE